MKNQDLINILPVISSIAKKLPKKTDMVIHSDGPNMVICIDDGIQQIAKGAEIKREEYSENGYTRLSVNIQGCKVSQLEVTDWNKFFGMEAAV